jgi:hypothetical protein
MKKFDERVIKGKYLIDDFIVFLKENEIDYILSGYEYLTGSSQSKSKVIKNNNETSLFIRHYPDIAIVFDLKSFLVEVKNSSGIEKDCYINYMKLRQEMNLDVWLFLKNKKMYRIEDVKFNKMSAKDYVADMIIPVTDGIWKEPRQMPQEEYYKYLQAYRNKNKNTSGCSFAFIDFDNSAGCDIDILLDMKHRYSTK